MVCLGSLCVKALFSGSGELYEMLNKGMKHKYKTAIMSSASKLWCVDPGCMPGAHQRCSITPQLDSVDQIYNERLIG